MGRLDELVERFNVADPDFIADPYPVLNALREQTPLFRTERTGHWMVTRFADVSRLLRDRRLGRTYSHRFSPQEFGAHEPDARWANFHEHERWSLLSLEPPDHTRLRKLVSNVFTPRAVAALGNSIEAVSAEYLSGCVDRGTFDLLADYAQPYSVAVICSMLGVPRSDTQLLLDWSHAIVKMYELAASDDVKANADRAAGEYIGYTRDLIADKRRTPDGLLISELARVESDGEVLSDDEITSTAMVLLEAGHEASVNTLGNGFRALMHHRNQWERVTNGEVDPAIAVEELLRWDAPLQLFDRWVLEPGLEIAGQPIAVGDRVAMLFGAAQRDPRRFTDPDAFDVARGDSSHIGFGGGIHFCIGAPLARLELGTAVADLATRLPGLQLVREPRYHQTFVIRGVEELILSAGR